MDKEKRIEEFEGIRGDILSCTSCDLCKTRTSAVPGEGDINAEVLFIGEAPGANEDKKGIPFCGAAGKFLDEMLAAIELSRDKVFITNTAKCRPPENRDPKDEEKSICTELYLDKQIEIINPLLIVCLGRHSAAYFLPTAGPISEIHGHVYEGPAGYNYLPLYHPAAALHNGGLRQTLMDDFKKIPNILEKIKVNINKQERKELPQSFSL